MTPTPDDKDHEQAEVDASFDKAAVDTDEPGGDSPRATSHPTGEKQAAENADNEPAG